MRPFDRPATILASMKHLLPAAFAPALLLLAAQSAPASKPAAAPQDADKEKDVFLQRASRRREEMKAMIDATNAAGKDLASKIAADAKEKEILPIDEPRRSDGTPQKFAFFVDTKDVPRPYLLAVEDVEVPRPAARAGEVGQILSALYATFYKRYAAHVQLKSLEETPVPVWVFASKGSYERWRRCGNGGPSPDFARAFYAGTMQRNASGFLYLWFRDPREEKDFVEDPVEEIREVIWHEGTHQLMDFNSPGLGFGVGNSPWVQEGFADYVGGYSRRPDRKSPDGWAYFFGVPALDRVKAIMSFGLQMKSQRGEKLEMNPSVREIAMMTYPEFWEARSAQEMKKGNAEGRKAAERISGTYSIGWGLCHFLQHAEKGKYRAQFNEWLRAELSKKASPKEFERIFGLDTDEAWEAFESEFQDYIVFGMRTDMRKVKAKDDSVFDKYRKDFEAACAEAPSAPPSNDK